VGAVASILDRLDRVRQTGPGRWIARCPSHEDRSPSLSIRELDDGRVLLHDLAGCDTEAVLTSLGLTLADLFPERLKGKWPGGYPHSASRISARSLLEVISEEVSVVALIASDVLERRIISTSDWTRLARAVARISRARDHIHGC
jgi:hypothetical protein